VTARHVRVRGPRVGALTGALCAAVFLSALAIGAWDLSGGRLVTMTTPSMCPTVCVGSLVAARPLEGPLHPGELVAFHPPGQDATYTHRVVTVERDGSFTTKGDAETSPDPWVIARSEVVGQVSFTVRGLGWWLHALPVLAVGTFVLLVARRAFRPSDRRSFERLFAVAVLVVPLLLERPLISGQLIEVTADPGHRGWLRGLFVNTGVLPSQLHVVGAGVLPHLGPSRLAWLHGPKVSATSMGVREWAALPWWGWAVVAAAVLSPVVGFVLYRATHPVEPDVAGIPVGEAIGLGAEPPASAQAGHRTVRELGHDRGGYDALQRGRAPSRWRDDQAGGRGLGDGGPTGTTGGRRRRFGSGRVRAFSRGARARPAHAAGGSLLNARSIAPRSSRAARRASGAWVR